MPPPVPRAEWRDAADATKFSPQFMVDWFNPAELARTSGRVVLASIFGSYADKREVQAALYHDEKEDERYLPRSEMWFDYIADVGDGFDSTYTLAWLLAKSELPTSRGQRVTRLQRGRVLLFGGDQVYPTASRQAYRDRMIGPYSHALPEPRRAPGKARESGEPSDLYAIPGNHDWYDGLTSFVRTFCQQRTLGGWHTRQRRSYFSIALPHDWWIWGIDIQLEADLDHPQLQYFESVATKMRERCKERRPKLIVITGEPAWVHCGDGPRRGTIEHTPDAFSNLEFFLNQTVAAFELDLRLMMAGDLHHYARYTTRDRTIAETGAADPTKREVTPTPVHLVTAGGGGAYLSATHHLCPELHVPVGAKDARRGERDTRIFTCRQTFPTTAESRQRTRGCFLLPLWSPTFAALVGLTYVLFSWQLQSSSRVDCVVPVGIGPGEQEPTKASAIIGRCWDAPRTEPGPIRLVHTSLMDVLIEGHSTSGAYRWMGRAAQEAPALFVEVAIFALLLYAFCAARPSVRRFAVTSVHVLAHVLLAATAMWTGAAFVRFFGDVSHMYDPTGPYYGGQGRTLVFGSFVFLFGATIGTLAFAAYLWLCAHLLTGAPHMNEVFSARRYKDLKHFIRFHLRSDGRIKAYVVAIPEVARRWNPATRFGPAWEPATEPEWRIIDRFRLEGRQDRPTMPSRTP